MSDCWRPPKPPVVDVLVSNPYGKPTVPMRLLNGKYVVLYGRKVEVVVAAGLAIPQEPVGACRG